MKTFSFRKITIILFPKQELMRFFATLFFFPLNVQVLRWKSTECQFFLISEEKTT